MIFVKNPSGEDVLDLTEDSSAERIGRRIRTIRMAQGLSQGELGELVGLTADRIQKYENGARKPKSDLLKKIANALKVSSLALADPTTSSYVNAMFTLFELEENYNMKVEAIGHKLCLTVDAKDGLYEYLNEWKQEYEHISKELEVVSSEKERDDILKTYHLWKWTFPKSIADKSAKERQKARLKSKIEELQAAYNKLSDDD